MWREARLKQILEMEGGGMIETNIGKFRTWVEGLLDLQKSGNEFKFRLAQIW